MKSIVFTDIHSLLPFLIILINFWFFFFKISFFSVNIKKNSFNTIKNFSYNYYFLNSTICRFSYILFTFLLFFLFTLKGYEENFWWNHFFLSNFNLNLICIFMFIFIFFLFSLNSMYSIIENIKNDYFFSLIFLFLASLLIYLVNNFFTFIFLIETISTSVFFKFISSKIWVNTNDSNLTVTNSYRKFLNMLFFQFWSTFFSTVIIFFYFIFLILYFGTTEWLLLNYLFILKLNYFSFIEILYFFFIFSLFFFGFFIKIGFTPLHLYKIEVYKGLTFFSIFFYTTIYFFIYFLYFILFIFVYFNSMLNFFFLFFLFISLISFIFLIIFMFDINYSKSFFAFSTISNSLIFVLLALVSNI